MPANDQAKSIFHVALVEPEIPQNTGNIARLCAATRTDLHIVGMPGFRLDARAVRRAGLDYWDQVSIRRHRDLEQLSTALGHNTRLLFFSTKAERNLWEQTFEPNDCLVFGPETRGLPETLLRENWDRCVRVPMTNPNVRSLNLANTVAIALYEALRQTSVRHS
jgi:tRNA (cytidine/uridine-2'-O-)-methyltransferase